MSFFKTCFVIAALGSLTLGISNNYASALPSTHISSQTKTATKPTGYQLVDLGSYNSDYSYSVASDMNNNGWIVGTAIKSDDSGNEEYLGFIYHDGAFHPLNPSLLPDALLAINDSGLIAGTSQITNDKGETIIHAAIYNPSSDQLQDLNPSADVQSGATGINLSGDVTGSFIFPDKSSHAFAYINGQISDLGTLPNRTNSMGININNQKQIVGASFELNGNQEYTNSRTFLWEEGKMKDLFGDSDQTENFPVAINNSGQVIGTYFVDDGKIEDYKEGAYIYADGELKLIPNFSAARGGINDAGDAVGILVADGRLTFQAAVYRNGVTENLNLLIKKPDQGLPEWFLTEGMAINNAGQIICSGVNTKTNEDHLFLLIPTP